LNEAREQDQPARRTDSRNPSENRSEGKESTSEREEALERQRELQEINNTLSGNCQKFAALDPEFVEQQRKSFSGS
jgi:ATP/maltotriose-dependent transcriptional regulator MalT